MSDATAPSPAPCNAEAIRQAEEVTKWLAENPNSDRPHGVALWGDPLDENCRILSTARRWLHAAVLRAASRSMQPHVMDIGCGGGRWAEAMRLRRGWYHAVDASFAAVEETRRRVRLDPFCERVLVRQYVACNETIPTGPAWSTSLAGMIDLIWSWDVFVHFERPMIDWYLDRVAYMLRPQAEALLHVAAGPKSSPHWHPVDPFELVSHAAGLGLTPQPETLSIFGGWESILLHFIKT